MGHNGDNVLTGRDYAIVPLSELVKHPDFSNHAMNIIAKIMSMSTKQIEHLSVLEADR